MLVCRNGTFIPHEDAQLPVNDGGFLYGDTLFETLKGKGQKILLLTEHLDRLELSARLLEFPCDRQRLENACGQLATALTGPISRIRITLSRGQQQGLTLPQPEKGWFLLTATEMAELTAAERQTGAVCVLAPNQRVNPLSHLPQMKRGNYADCLYAAAHAKQRRAHEALFRDQNGHIIEGSCSNIFALVGEELTTPPVGNLVLAGIMRRQVFSAAAELGIRVIERNLPLEDITNAAEVFLTNSLYDIYPVSSIEGQKLHRGNLWKELLETLRLRIET